MNTRGLFSRPLIPLSLAALLLLAAGCAKAPETPPPSAITIGAESVTIAAGSPKLSAFTIVPAEPQTVATHRLSARLIWDEDATVRIYSPVAGRVRWIAPALGARVPADATLALIDSPDLGQAQSDLQKALADRLLAERALARAKDLFEHGAVARKDLESAEDTFANAQSEQQRAAARLALYGAKPGREVDGVFALHTPLGGTVVEKNVNAGQEVRPDQMLANVPQLAAPLFVVSDPTKLWLQLDAAETDLAVLRVGETLQVHSRAYPDRVFSGTIDNIGAALDPQSRAVKIRGVVANPDGLLKAEMYVSVDIAEPASRSAGVVLAVPAKAVFLLDDRHYLFVEAGPGKFERRQVRIGTEQDGRIPVLGGIDAGQRVVAEGALLLEALLTSN